MLSTLRRGTPSARASVKTLQRLAPVAPRVSQPRPLVTVASGLSSRSWAGQGDARVSVRLRQFCAAPETAETTSKQAAKPAQTHEFKAETKKLLDIVAKSLYTDKEVFIRELISNSSDACEKLRFLQTTSALKETHDSDLALQVRLTTNEAERTFIIEDTGVGMTYDELVENLGTIAKSGSLAFSENVEHDASNIIGQFGVGFYSSFVVADKVEVFTKTCDPAKGDTGYLWSSDGSGEYSISETPGIPRGTKIVLTLKDDAADFSKQAFVKKAVEKFSSFIDFPILIEEGGEFKPVNKQEALWTKTSATPEEHTAFFRFLSGNSYGEPYYSLMYQTDAPLSIKSCFYLPDPDNAPSRFFSRDPEIGVALHSRRVLVKKNADGVIPKWLHWVRGVVDCEDMPMNISRENMQDSRLMEKLSTAVVRRILRFLEQQAKKDEEKYAKFFKAYSYYLKAGIIEDKEGNFGRHKEDLMKLLRFECSEKGKGELVSLADYMSAAKDGQQNIYYLTSTDRNTAVASPYMEQFTQRKRNVLLLFEDIDEFVISSLENFKGHKFVSVDAADKDFELDLDAPEEDAEKKGRELESDERKSLEQFIKSVLKERVQEVKFSDRVVSSPAIVTSIITPHMRKMMKGLMAGKENDGYSNIPMTLELSASHHIVTTLNSIKESNEPVARIAVEQLFDNACIAAGTLDDPRVLMSRLNKVLEMFVYQGAGFDYARNEYVTRDSADAAVEKSTEADGKEAPTQADQNTSPPKTDKQVPPPKAEVKTEPPKFEEVKPSA